METKEEIVYPNRSRVVVVYPPEVAEVTGIVFPSLMKTIVDRLNLLMRSVKAIRHTVITYELYGEFLTDFPDEISDGEKKVGLGSAICFLISQPPFRVKFTPADPYFCITALLTDTGYRSRSGLPLRE